MHIKQNKKLRKDLKKSTSFTNKEIMFLCKYSKIASLCKVYNLPYSSINRCVERCYNNTSISLSDIQLYFYYYIMLYTYNKLNKCEHGSFGFTTKTIAMNCGLDKVLNIYFKDNDE